MRRAILSLAILAGLLPAVPGFARADAARQAEHIFDTILSLQQRLTMQNALIAGGYLQAVPTERFTARIGAALRRLQAEHGLPAGGQLDVATVEKVFAIANQKYRMWNFERFTHPLVRRSLPIPTGLGLARIPNDRGIAFRDGNERLLIRFNHFAETSAAANYAELKAKYRRTGVKINYDVFRGNWFVFSTTSPSGTDGYLRYHEDDAGGITGFAMFWNDPTRDFAGERIAILMSSALHSEMGGGPFAMPPSAKDFALPQIASRPEPAPPPAPSPPPAAVPAPEAPRPKASSGTGFFVSGDGMLVTNAHVVQGCASIAVQTRERNVRRARLLARDETNDLALLTADFAPARHANLRAAARLGEDVAAFGFPHSDLFASSGNFTIGTVTATSGLRDDSRFLQVSAPVHSGNSGGPLLDDRANVVGVVTAKLDAVKFAAGSGDLPQNVNFALKTDLLMTFLRGNGVALPPDGADRPRLERADIADLARDISVHVTCR